MRGDGFETGAEESHHRISTLYQNICLCLLIRTRSQYRLLPLEYALVSEKPEQFYPSKAGHVLRGQYHARELEPALTLLL